MTKRQEKLSKFFNSLGDPTRLEILNTLTQYPGICVSALADELDLSVSAVSQQCKLMELSGILKRERKGQRICYQINSEEHLVKRLVNLIQGGDK
ncbi:winged helix-turn-helix transcriptional regulator [Candidatus Saccharibacteria bacterium]|nr:winged helix-turn-helix transcriptional regulator [Candidatus Saccharibacteria bacterium]